MFLLYCVNDSLMKQNIDNFRKNSLFYLHNFDYFVKKRIQTNLKRSPPDINDFRKKTPPIC